MDGKCEAIQLSTGDVFALDGNRLLLKSGTYGANGAQYATENETFAKIISINTQGNGPLSFSVLDKNGNIIEYGGNADARLTSASDNNILTWYISKITDEYGNYMTYTYKTLAGERVIQEIDYTGNSSGPAPYNSIQFDYIDKAEKNTVYYGGQPYKNTQLLKSITCLSGSNMVKKYEFDYVYDKATLLASIAETNADGTQLNPTTFCWSDPYVNSSLPSSASLSLFTSQTEFTGLSKVITADLDGNGFSDAVCAYPGLHRTTTKINNYKYTNLPSANLSFNATDYFNTFTSSSNILGSFVLDVDNDNHQEVYCFADQNFDNTSYNLYKITEAGVVGTPTFVTLSAGYNFFTLPSQLCYDVSDYSGDGVNDEMVADPEKIKLTTSAGLITYALTGNSIARPMDFDGDGATDIVLLTPSGTNKVLTMTILKYNGSSNQIVPVLFNNISFPNATSGMNLPAHIGLGDFNGDGKTDVTYLDEMFTNLYVSYSTGSVYTNPAAISAFTAITPNNVDYYISTPDINSDGRSDIIISNTVDNSGAGPGAVDNYFSYYPLGDIFVKGPNAQGNWTLVEQNYLYYRSPMVIGGITIGDFYTDNGPQVGMESIPVKTHNFDLDGDGVYDVLSLSTINLNGSNYNDLQHQNIMLNDITSTTATYLYRITTGMGNRIRLSYANLNTEFDKSKTIVYGRESTTAYALPLVDYKPSGFAVSEVTFDNSFYSGASPVSNTYRYSYYDAIFHKGGRGFLGFEKTITTQLNAQSNLTTYLGSVVKNTFDVNRFIPLNTENTQAKLSVQNVLSGVIKYSLGTTNLMSKSTIQYAIAPSSVAQGFFVSPQTVTYLDYLSSTGKTTTYNFSQAFDGRPTAVTTAYGWPSASPVRTESQTISYILTGPGAVPSTHFKPLNVALSMQQGSDPAHTRSIDYAYDMLGRLGTVQLDKTIDPAHSLLTTYLGYNFYGEPTQVSTQAPDITSRSSSVVYDATGRFIIKTFNPLNYTEEYTYEPLFGNLLQYQDIAGLTTSYRYDGQGRLVETTLPTGAINTVEYSLVKPAYQPSSQNGVFSVTYKNEAQPGATQYFDAQARLLRTEQQSFGGAIVTSDNTYDGRGWLSTSSEPHFTNQTNYLSSQYNYTDNFFRLSFVNINQGTTTFYSNGYQYSLSSTDASYNQGTVNFSTRGNYNVKKFFNAGGQTEKVQTIEGLPQNSAYTYNSNGQPSKIELSYGSGPVTVTHNFSYDNLGRQTQLVDPSSGTINYVYNTLGELTRQTDALGDWVYAYDILGRLQTRTGNTSGDTYSYQYVTSGNGLAQVQKITGPNTTTEYQYDNFSRTTEYKETHTGNKIFKTDYTYDHYGRPDSYTYPGGFATKNTYDNLGYLTQISNAANGFFIWQLDALSATGEATKYTLGNGLQTVNTIDPLHELTLADFGALHRQKYVYGNSSGNDGNMYNRTFIKNPAAPTPLSLVENFDYDQNRLKLAQQVDVSNNPLYTNNILFDPNGNITHKDDAGDYVYGQASKPFQLTNINNAQPNISLNTLNVIYNDFRKVKQITEASTNKEMDFTYGNFDERIRMDYKLNNNAQYSRFYCDNFDREEAAGSGNYKEWSYIYAPTGLAAVYYNNNGTGALYYTNTDHLGSPIMLTDQSQNVVEEHSFDAWGRRRDPASWSYSLPSGTSILNRGFTMHEHIDEFGLINMNGRVYDPVLGRFIQPDNIVQDPDNVQTFNRYSYVMNNPLKYIDPSGWGGEGAGGGIFNPIYDAPNYGTSYIGDETGNNNGDLFTYYTQGWNGGGEGIGATGGGGGGGNGFSIGGTSFSWASPSGGSSGYSGAGSLGGQTGLAMQGFVNFIPSLPNAGGGSMQSTSTYQVQTSNVPASNNNYTYLNSNMFATSTYNRSNSSTITAGTTYTGNAYWGTNFIGPSEAVNPLFIKRNGKIITPIDALDRAAQLHDLSYYLAGVDGAAGAFLSPKIMAADALLLKSAQLIIQGYPLGVIDPITGEPISERTYYMAVDVQAGFSIILMNKKIMYGPSSGKAKIKP